MEAEERAVRVGDLVAPREVALNDALNAVERVVLALVQADPHLVTHVGRDIV